MKKILLLSLFIILLSGCQKLPTKQNKPNSENQNKSSVEHYSYILEKDFFDSSFEKTTSGKEKNKIFGAITSHHLLATDSLANFFNTLGDQQIETIVIIGPNHFNTGNNNILVAKNPYKTPYGILEPDIKIINELINNGLIKNEEDPFRDEHSISALVSYVKKTFPDIKFIPIILKNNVSPEQAEHLGIQLNKFLPKNSLIIASCDFAHHVDYETAIKYDRNSLEVINNFDFNNIYNMEVDSPASIYTLFSYLKQKEAGNFVLVENLNAADILNEFDYQDVTSYIFGYFL